MVYSEDMKNDDEENDEKISPELKALAQKLGVEIRPKWDKPDIVDQVRFKFSQRTWSDLCNKEGELLPSCCANISAIRDEFVSALREDGWLHDEQLATIVVNTSGHKDDFKGKHPVAQVVAAYKALESHLRLSGPSDVDPNDVRDMACQVWFGKVWQWCAEYTNNSMFDNWGLDVCDRAAHNRALFQILPVLKCLSEKAASVGFPPVEGYAIVRIATGRVYEMRRGFAIFETQKEAEDVLGRWVKTDGLDPKDAEIRAARVSFEKGIEFLDKVETPFFQPRPNPEITEQQRRDACDAVFALREKIKNDKVRVILHEALDKICELAKGR